MTDPDAEAGDELYSDPDRMLTSFEVGEMLGMSASSFRSYVVRGLGPKPDDPDLGTARNRRVPKWKLSTVAQWQHSRPRRPRRPKEEEEEG